ncbi:MAG: BspA family leucine-rich repeat surface protein [Muribaculaceae bacterium]|nr:BspA family leucine-rich repeat surface protein [Muribaculaceae bacterium]
MKVKLLFLHAAALVAAMMCALGGAAAEAYANYTSSNTTLTFYYDDLRSSRTGRTYDLNTGYIDTGWESDGTNANVSKVVFDPSFADARPTTTYAWFSEMNNLQSIQGLRYLNTSQVTNMRWMFGGCTSLTAIDVAGFNTSKVTDMYAMFNSCWNLRGLDLTSFNTSKVTDMRAMFFSCGSLQTIYVLDGWTTAAVTQSSSMFEYCSDLVGGNGTTYDDNHIDAAYAHIDGYNYGPGYFTIPINNEAYACYTYDNTLSFHYDRIRSFRDTRTYDLNTGATNVAWDTDGTNTDVTQVVIDPSFANASPTSTYDWFFGMENLQSIQGLRHLNTNMVTNMGWMFSGCEQLNAIDLSGFLTSRVTDMSFMFWGCTNLKSLDLTSFNTAKVTKMPSMFYGCNHLETIIVGDNWSTAAVTNSTDMFNNCTNLVGGQGTTYDASHVDKTYAHLDYGTSNPGYFTAQLEAYVMYNGSAMALTFYYDNQRKYRSATTYDLNTSTYNPDWITNSPGRVNHVVFDPSFAGARPSSTWHWFADMINLQDVTGMEYLNTSNVGYMGYMFYDCITLTALDLSNFNTADVVRTDYMFYNCNNLRTIFGGDGWNTNRVALSTNMFYSCTKLTGDQGTTYDASHVNKAYAHLDGGTSNPGYFSRFKEAYACYTPGNTTLTFYYDNQRSSRAGTTYDLNTGGNTPAWRSDGTYENVTKVVFDPSFAGTYPTSTFGWFNMMTNLQSVQGLSYLNTDYVSTMGWMFSQCNKLTSIDVSHFNTSRVNQLDYMFYKCEQLTVLDLSSFNTANVHRMFFMFADCRNLKTIYAGEGWTTAAVEDAAYMFRNCTSLVGGKGTTYDANHIDKAYAHIDGGTSNPGYFTEWKEAYACYTPSNTTLTFYYDSQRSSRSGTTYDLNTGDNDTGWENDGTNANVSRVVFDPSFANARPTTTYSWFYNMRNLQSITGLSYLNTSEVTNMGWMFTNCNKLTSLDVSHFNTSKVIYMNQLFSGCTGLTSLDLSSFNTSNVTIKMSSMFYNCYNLRTIYVGSGWSTAAVTNSTNMFFNCTSLVGGQGTTWNESNPTDKTYAHIDGGTSNPGYFTAKNAGLRGDVDGNGNVNISDVTALINLLLKGNTSGNTAADADQNGSVNISDVTALINYLLRGTW